MHFLTRRPRTRFVVATLLFVAIFGPVWMFRALFGVPDSKSDAEWHLDRPLLAYDVWDGTPIVVFEIDMTGKIYIDQLRLDPISIRWPPVPRSQWTGSWASVATTNDPASVGYGQGNWGTAFFGQATDPAIVTIRCQMETYVLEESVSAPGYAVELLSGEDPPASCEFLDADGSTVWTAPVVKSVV